MACRGARLECALAAVLDETRRVVDAGFLPGGGGLGGARSWAMRGMGLEPPGERDDGLERDAGDRPVGRRGDLEPRQLGFVLHEGGLLDRAVRRGGRAADESGAPGQDDQHDDQQPCSNSHAHVTRPPKARVCYSAATASRRLASIWLMASTTASKVRTVEAWPPSQSPT